MKLTLIGLCLFANISLAVETAKFGIYEIEIVKPLNPTQVLLDEQASSGPVEESEISNFLFVETQKRLANSFLLPIPERIGQSTRDQ